MALPAPSSANKGKRREVLSPLFANFGSSKNAAILEKQSQQLSTAKPHLASTRGYSSFSSAQQSPPWLVPVSIPFIQGRRVILVPYFLATRPQSRRQLSADSLVYTGAEASVSKQRVIVFGLLALTSLLYLLARLRPDPHSGDSVEESTLVMSPLHIRRIWAYEIMAGHYPSRRRLPASASLTAEDLATIGNPATPPADNMSAASRHRHLPNISDNAIQLLGSGPLRQYLSVNEQSRSTSGPWAPRPLPESIIDLDVVMDHCDFSQDRYVRDCLEVLRVGANLDPGLRVRRGRAEGWRHLYTEPSAAATRASSFGDVHNHDRTEVNAQDLMQALGYDGPAATKATDPKQQLLARSEPLFPPQANPSQPNRARVGAGPSRRPHASHLTADPACDPDYPRIFHVFWAGAFTDKPYIAVLSFLFTQNLGLHLGMPMAPHSFSHPLKPASSARDQFLSTVCRPQLWVWINPGPAAAVPNPAAHSDMFEQLRSNPWSAPFLHRRFQEVVKFKLWNTTEQLDGVPELKHAWRDLPLFNSGGVKYKGSAGEGDHSSVATPADATTSSASNETGLSEEDSVKRQVIEENKDFGRFGNVEAGEEAVARDWEAGRAAAKSVESLASGDTRAAPSPTAGPVKPEDELYERVGSTSSSGYDRLSVVLSDMARFVLCHRFGGVYLDADTLLLRDWEELWGWHGAFAYRWSRLEKYNTAVLRLHRNSAIGSFLFKTALANGLDFHPMTISRYTKDAEVEGLLLRLPDALFDPAWLKSVSLPPLTTRI